MSRLRHSLRVRLALVFAVFGILISLLVSAGLFLAVHSLGLRLMDETLSAEVDDYLSRRHVNPKALLPSSMSISGYAHLPGQPAEGLSPELADLAPGSYDMTLDDIPYRISVADKAGKRFVMLFNATQHQLRERTFLTYIVFGTLIMVAFSAWMGWWLAGRIVSPVTELARRVSIATPEDGNQQISVGFSEDEIGRLAKVFQSYLTRMKAFIERERAFTADVSHELRTPLAIVQGVVELLDADGRLDDKQQERVARIGRANREMIDLTAALLLMAREQSSDESGLQCCDVWDVVCDVVETHRHLVSPQTSVELDCQARLLVAAERTLLAIVVANLVRNAFAYTGSGSVSISLAECGLTIRDTGSGISGEEIGKVFERHYRGAESTGAGIGLSLVKRICDRYGWKADIWSEVGLGTVAKLGFTGSARNVSDIPLVAVVAQQNEKVEHFFASE